MKLFAFVGRSNTGKTTLIKLLILELKKRGYSLGTIKWCSHGFSLDLEGKDSWYLMEAGANAVALISDASTAFIKNNKVRPSIKNIAQSYFKNMDVVLSEGGRRETHIEKIEVLRKGVQMAPESPVDSLSAVIADFDVELSIPVFKPNEINKIANFIERGIKQRDISVSLEVDEKNITLNKFLQTEFANILSASVEPLHGIGGCPEEIDLSIQDASKIYLKINKKRVGLNRFLRKFILNIVLGMVRTLKGVPRKPRKLVIGIKYDI
ncbi:MAG: molybdopterin-guanine dinucleotide biosynthesis protein B [Candidatus Aminicenantes bacterium]